MEYSFQLANMCFKEKNKDIDLICFMFQSTKEMLVYPK